MSKFSNNKVIGFPRASLDYPVVLSSWGQMLEMEGKTKKHKGEQLAREILDSGKASEKFKAIINAQQGKIKKLTR